MLKLDLKQIGSKVYIRSIDMKIEVNEKNEQLLIDHGQFQCFVNEPIKELKPTKNKTKKAKDDDKFDEGNDK